MSAQGLQQLAGPEGNTSMQHPIMSVVTDATRDGQDGAAWDAQTSADLAAMLAQYLTANPAPPGALTACHWSQMAQRLAADAELRSAALGRPARSLRVA